MNRLLFIKLGGSLITNKQIASSFYHEAVAAVGLVLRDVVAADPELRILVGHGSGSFGHVVARQYGTINGVHTPADWRGFAHVATAAADLNALVTSTLRAADLPIWRIQPSASAYSRDGELMSMAVAPIESALANGLMPLVYGDVSLDETRGGTIISTETVFFYLAQHLSVDQILLLGDVEGVYDSQGVTIPLITPMLLPTIESALGGSAGTDVTGGMASKVRHMLRLVTAVPSLSIRIMGGDPDLVRAALLGQAQPGTLIKAD